MTMKVFKLLVVPAIALLASAPLTDAVPVPLLSSPNAHNAKSLYVKETTLRDQSADSVSKLGEHRFFDEDLEHRDGESVLSRIGSKVVWVLSQGAGRARF